MDSPLISDKDIEIQHHITRLRDFQEKKIQTEISNKDKMKQEIFELKEKMKNLEKTLNSEFSQSQSHIKKKFVLEDQKNTKDPKEFDDLNDYEKTGKKEQMTFLENSRINNEDSHLFSPNNQLNLYNSKNFISSMIKEEYDLRDRLLRSSMYEDYKKNLSQEKKKKTYLDQNVKDFDLEEKLKPGEKAQKIKEEKILNECYGEVLNQKEQFNKDQTSNRKNEMDNEDISLLQEEIRNLKQSNIEIMNQMNTFKSTLIQKKNENLKEKENNANFLRDENDFRSQKKRNPLDLLNEKISQHKLKSDFIETYNLRKFVEKKKRQARSALSSNKVNKTTHFFNERKHNGHAYEPKEKKSNYNNVSCYECHYLMSKGKSMISCQIHGKPVEFKKERSNRTKLLLNNY